MLNGLIKNIMVKSIVTILLSTSTVGNTTTETKTVENIDNNTKQPIIALKYVKPLYILSFIFMTYYQPYL